MSTYRQSNFDHSTASDHGPPLRRSIFELLSLGVIPSGIGPIKF